MSWNPDISGGSSSIYTAAFCTNHDTHATMITQCLYSNLSYEVDFVCFSWVLCALQAPIRVGFRDSANDVSQQQQTHACILEVLSVEPVQLGPEAAAAVTASSHAAASASASAASALAASSLLRSADAADADAHEVSQHQHNTADSGADEGSSGPGVGFCEARILLHTGRTHQIRAQMAAEGFPLVGDLLYGALHAMGALWQPPPGGASSAPPSSSSASAVPDPITAGMSGSRVDWRGVLGEPGRSRVALQAWRLEVHDPGAAELMGSCPAVFTAGVPWWQT